MAVYWIGANGNAYVKGDDGSVKDYGKADAGSDDSQVRIYREGYGNLSIPANRIADPNPPKQTTPTGTGGGGTDPNKKVLNQAAIDNTQKALASLDDELNIGYGNIDQSYGSLVGKYDQERGRTRQDYEEEGVTNTQNLQRNKQNALVSGAQGLRGLRGVLGSIGALSGDGSVLANRAVTSEVNQDIGGAVDTAGENAKTLDKAWTRFDEEDQDRRREAETTRTNQRTALEGSIASKRQNFFQKLAELYGEVGDIGNATNWLNRAGDLNPVIAQKSRVASTPFTERAAAFTPGELESYLAGATDMTVDVRQGGEAGAPGPNSLLAGGRREKEDERRRKLALA